MKSSKVNLTQGVIIWTLTACFFLYEFFARASIAPMALLLEQAFNSTHAELGLISSAYYFAYAAMQIPIGLLVDRFGVRWLLTLGAFFCALGCLLFAAAHSISVAFAGRFLMGLGSSVAFVSLLTIALHWFSRKIYGLMTGLTQILGMIGPMLAGAPLAWALITTENNWRLIMFNTAIIGFALAVVVFLFVRNHPNQHILHKKAKTLSLRAQVVSLIKHPQIRWIGIYAFFIYPAVSLIGELWGTAFLEHRGFSLSDAASINSFLWLGLGFGSPLVGAISDALGSRKHVLTACAIFGILVSLLLIWLPLNFLGYALVFFGIGFAAGGQTLSFAALEPYAPAQTESTAIGLNNTMVMLGGGIMQYLSSSLLDFTESAQWTYPYETAMSLMTLFFVVALWVSARRIKDAS